MPGVRRVVTGHDQRGRAVVKIDDEVPSEQVGGTPARFVKVWTTATSPADNTDDFDGSKRETGLTSPGGTVLRFVDFPPVSRSGLHRTNSIDYGIVLEGELDMELDDGQLTHLRAGDVVVQRGTLHAWINVGSRPARMAFVLIDARPAAVGGTTLAPTTR
jgi:quercetin dioxygenase-like cupin family protein